MWLNLCFVCTYIITIHIWNIRCEISLKEVLWDFIQKKSKLLQERAWCHKGTMNDVIKWKHFPRFLLLVRGIHRSPVDSLTKASNAELWCFLWCATDQMAQQIVDVQWWWFETPSCSLWRHSNVNAKYTCFVRWLCAVDVIIELTIHNRWTNSWINTECLLRQWRNEETHVDVARTSHGDS